MPRFFVHIQTQRVWAVELANETLRSGSGSLDEPPDTRAETYPSAAAAQRELERRIADKLEEGFVEHRDTPVFEGLDTVGSQATLTLAELDEHSVEQVRSIFAHLRDTGCEDLVIEGCFGIPLALDQLWTRAMSGLVLPTLTEFRFGVEEGKGPKLTDLCVLFECCPALETAFIQGYGPLRPVEANQLQSLYLSDTFLDEASTLALAESRFPALRIAYLSGDMVGLDLCLFLEQAAPQLMELEIDSASAAELLEAEAPHLVELTVTISEFDEFMDAVAEHSIPGHWRSLHISGIELCLDEAREFFTAHGARFAHLETLALNYPITDTLGGELVASARALEVLRPLCPALEIDDDDDHDDHDHDDHDE